MENKIKGVMAFSYIGSRYRQQGTTLVETAITLSLFMVLVMGIFEMALLIFDWSRAVEVTRHAARIMVVNTPPAILDGIDCSVEGSEVTFSCGDEDCGAAFNYAQAVLPRLKAEQLVMTYSCTSAGNEARPEEMPIFLLKTQINNYSSRLRIPTLVGFPANIPMPEFETTRLTEDMHTPGG